MRFPNLGMNDDSQQQGHAAARRTYNHGRGIGRFFGNGICPVIGGSMADARAFGNGLRIAAAAFWKAAAAFASALGR
jgi:hypothetical protein